jgi:RimJ/RimL family protein N-acetyltransferase
MSGRNHVRELESERLVYRPLVDDDLDVLHALVVEPHIREYMMDGQVLERSFTKTLIEASHDLLAKRKVGLWLVQEGPALEAIGFCGFHVFEVPDPEPQILYAFTLSHTGRGYASEATRAMLELVEGLDWRRVVTAVDEPNKASLRILQKFGFARLSSFPGAFGQVFYLGKTLSHPDSQ